MVNRVAIKIKLLRHIGSAHVHMGLINVQQQMHFTNRLFRLLTICSYNKELLQHLRINRFDAIVKQNAE